MEIEEVTETDQEIGAEVSATIAHKELCMMSLVQTVGKRPKSHLNQLKADPYTAWIAFRSIGLREQVFDSSIEKVLVRLGDF